MIRSILKVEFCFINGDLCENDRNVEKREREADRNKSECDGAA